MKPVRTRCRGAGVQPLIAGGWTKRMKWTPLQEVVMKGLRKWMLEELERRNFSGDGRRREEQLVK